MKNAMKAFFAPSASLLKRAAEFAKNHQLLLVIALLCLLTVSASATDTNVLNLVTYDDTTGSITWSFAGLLKLMVGGLAAAIGAGAIIFVITAGYRFAKKFIK